MKNSLVTVGKVNTITYLNTYVNDAKYNRLLAIPVINKNNMYALYWVASPYNKSQMYYVNEIGKQDTRINCVKHCNFCIWCLGRINANI